MNPIPVIYENGVFRPTVPVVLPEGTKGEALVENGAARSDATLPNASGDGMDEIYEILSRRYNSGHTDTAARHNEHQP